MSQHLDLSQAVELALSGKWDAAHRIVQDLDHGTACWIHAVLHKIEGDIANSRYWYARSSHLYEEYVDPKEELKRIAASLSGQ